MFVGADVREAVNDGPADYIPVFLSEVPDFFRNGVLPLDVALLQVSPPDKHGYCSLGVSVDASNAAL
jgi:acyl-CoA hydrolase